MKLENSILERIKAENIRPIPRWRFTVENRLIWLVEILLFVLGSLVAVLLWNFFQRNYGRLSFSAFPYLLLGSLVLIMLAVRRYSLKLEWGYGLAPLVFLGLFLTGNAALGTVLHLNQVPKAAEMQLKKLPSSVHKIILPEVEELEEKVEHAPEDLEDGGKVESGGETEDDARESDEDEGKTENRREDDSDDREDQSGLNRERGMSGGLLRPVRDDSSNEDEHEDSDVEDVNDDSESGGKIEEDGGGEDDSSDEVAEDEDEEEDPDDSVEGDDERSRD